MQFIEIENANKLFKAPEDLPECRDLAVRYEVVDGIPCHTCEIQPSFEDIQAMVNGAPIRLRLLGESWPPVALWVKEPDEV